MIIYSPFRLFFLLLLMQNAFACQIIILMTLHNLIQSLPQYAQSEARAIVLLVLESAFGISHVDACLGALDRLSDADSERLAGIMRRIAQGEPVQYVLGFAEFMGREFQVEKGVLIPRPETAELVEWIKADCASSDLRVLDIGCGSGCISVSLALELNRADVTAWDISETALHITAANAKRLGVSVNVVRQDALNAPDDGAERWDVIVSNPPYICNREAEEMESHVLDYEPHEALFVPDDDALLFYRAIARYARRALRPNGSLYFEINRAYAAETTAMLRTEGFADVELRHDQFGNPRMIRARVGGDVM